jgi:fumarate reductase subunit D
MKKENLFKISLIALAILLAGASRFVSDIPNFSPMLSIALFSGYMFRNKVIAFLIPLSAQFISDMYFGFHPDMLAVYFSFSIIIAIGYFNQEKYSLTKSMINSIIGTVIFFLLTNFSVWLTSGFYTNNFSGLLNSYTLAIPFYKNTLLSAIIYSTILFASYDLLSNKIFNEKLKAIEIK